MRNSNNNNNWRKKKKRTKRSAKANDFWPTVDKQNDAKRRRAIRRICFNMHCKYINKYFSIVAKD